MDVISDQSPIHSTPPEPTESLNESLFIDSLSSETPEKDKLVVRDVTSTELPTMVLVIFVFLIVIGSMVGVFIGFYLGVNIGNETSNDDISEINRYDDPISVIFSSPSVTKVTRGASSGDSITVWDANLQIQDVTPDYKRVEWIFIRISIVSESGSALISSSTPTLDDPTYYSDYVPIEVEFWFIDIQGDGKTNAGDGLKITGLSQEYEGATVQVMQGPDLIASVKLPTDFP